MGLFRNPHPVQYVTEVYPSLQEDFYKKGGFACHQ